MSAQVAMFEATDIEKGDQVRFEGGQGKVIAFSPDAKRVQVAYLAFDGPAKKWLDIDDVSKNVLATITPPLTPPREQGGEPEETDGTQSQPLPKPLPTSGAGLEPTYTAGDVVVTRDEFVLVIETPVRELPAGTYQCSNLHATGLGTVTDSQIDHQVSDKGERLAFVQQYQKAKENRQQKPHYQKGDVVLLANGLVKEILGTMVEGDIDPDEKKQYEAGERFATKDLMSGGVGSTIVTAFIAKLPVSAAMGMKRLSMLYHSNCEDNKRLERIRRQQEEALKDAIETMAKMKKTPPLTPPGEQGGEKKQIVSVDPVPVNPVISQTRPTTIKVLPIGEDGLKVPEGWRLHEVKSVFNVISENATHYAVIVQ